MRIAAGIILIIAAVFNLFAGLTYLAGGAALSGVSEMSETAVESVAQDFEYELNEDEQAAVDEVGAGIDASGGVLSAFALFLLASVVILIVGAIFLFMAKKPMFILVAAIVAILAEVGGIVLTGFGVTNTVGIIGGILALVAWNTIRQTPDQPPLAA